MIFWLQAEKNTFLGYVHTRRSLFAGKTAKKESAHPLPTKGKDALNWYYCEIPEIKAFRGFGRANTQVWRSRVRGSELGQTISVFDIIPNLFYPFLLLISSLVFIFVIPDKKQT